MMSADFSNADLSGADFRDSILNGANFSGADLSVVLIRGARLGHNVGLKVGEKFNLKARGAILDESPLLGIENLETK
jgi:uncharacterized protein YjbI with pentapeptide repeats